MRTEGQTEEHVEANSRFFTIVRTHLKTTYVFLDACALVEENLFREF